MNLKGKVAIVTGSSRGIGFAIAELFSKKGAKVVITSQNKENVKNAQSKIKNSIGITADVKNTIDVKKVIKKTIKEFGKLDILVNNAGIFPRIRRLHEIPEEEWNKVIDTNLTGVFRFTKEAIPHMLDRGGVIINVSSDAALRAYPSFNADAYSASKAAINLLTKTWALQYAKEKIRVNAVCPGVVETDMTAPFLKTKQDRDFVNNDHPIGRIGTPQEVAKAVAFLASSDSSWTTGAILVIDGGESLK